MSDAPRYSIGVLIPSLGGVYFSAVLRGIQRAAREHNVEVLAFQGFTPERICQTRLGLSRVAGWVVVLEAWWTEELQDQGRPVVTIAAPTSASICPAVVVDNRGGVQEAVRHLVAHGHQRIAFAGYLVQDDVQERFEGYLAGLAEAGLAFDSTLVIPLESNAVEEGRVAGERLRELGMPCTALIAGADWNAIGLIETLRAAGYRVPEDLAVVGFDDMEAGRYCEPPLTTVRQDFEALGQTATEHLLRQCAGEAVPAQIVRLPTALVVRGSCGCAWTMPPPAEGPSMAALAPQKRFEDALVHNHYLEELLLRSYRITATLFKEGAKEIARLDWLSQASASWGAIGLWANSEDDRLAISGVYDPQGYLPYAVAADCAPEQFPPAQRSYPTPARPNEIIQVLRIRSYTQPPLEEWGFLAVASQIDTYTSLKEWYTTKEGEHVEMWAYMLGEALQREAIMASLTQAKQAAEEANRLKMQFLTNISHELRTPLNAIIGFTEMLHAEQFAALDARLHLQHRLLFNSTHLLGLINDILDLARLEAGRIELDAEEGELGTLLHSVMATALGLTRDKQLDLRLELPPHLPPVLMDAKRIRQVLLNLLANAAKFTERGGITVRASLAEEGFVTVAVQDTGIGIDPQFHGMIFEEFRQLQGALNREYGGTGLGLPISRRLVELHGGRMWLESEPGAGATFFFTVPLSGAAGAQPAPGAEQHKLVLVVDDELALDQSLQQYLTRQGYEVQQQRDPARALEQIQAQQPQLVIVNTQTSAFDGWQLLEQLRGNPATANLPVLASPLVEQQALGLSLGANDYLIKPVGVAELGLALQRWGSQAASVLVVDDHADTREIMSLRLESMGYQVLQAANGVEALEVIRERRPDLIILDLMMPKLDGFAVLDELRADPASAATPVIVLTAQVLSEAELARLNQSVSAVLEKGIFHAEEILNQVQTHLTSSHKLKGSVQQVVHTAMTYIHGHYAEQLSRDEIADHAGVSTGHLARCFQQELGISPMTYLTRYRIRQARLLLERRKMSVAEVAQAVGFANEFYFSRVFRREEGVAPGAYRRGVRRPE